MIGIISDVNGHASSIPWPVKVKVTQSCPTLCDPMDHTVRGILQDRILEWVAYRFSRGSSQPRSPTLQVDSLPTERRGKPTNTGGGNLSLLQGIFLTQELNWGVLHCRWILYQLSYEGSPQATHRYTLPLSTLHPSHRHSMSRVLRRIGTILPHASLHPAHAGSIATSRDTSDFRCHVLQRQGPLTPRARPEGSF